jgi:hypothetical protein
MSTNLPYSDLVRVRFSDTDAQGHLYFANYLVYADEVVGHYMEELGFSAMNPGEAPCWPRAPSPRFLLTSRPASQRLFPQRFARPLWRGKESRRNYRFDTQWRHQEEMVPGD